MSNLFSYYYDLMSQPSRAMWIILKLSGTEFKDCPVALRNGEHLTEEYKTEVNRFQRVPCINDDGFKLSESIAILRYLSSQGKISPALYPSDLRLRARVDELLEWQHLNIRLGCSLYFRKKFLEPMLSGKEVKPEKIEGLKKIMEDILDVFENVWLGNAQYLAGDKLTVADLFAACELEQTRMAGYDACDKYPKIKEWINRIRIETNPFYDDAHKYVNRIANAQAKL